MEFQSLLSEYAEIISTLIIMAVLSMHVHVPALAVSGEFSIA